MKQIANLTDENPKHLAVFERSYSYLMARIFMTRIYGKIDKIAHTMAKVGD